MKRIPRRRKQRIRSTIVPLVDGPACVRLGQGAPYMDKLRPVANMDTTIDHQRHLASVTSAQLNLPDRALLIHS